jgi:hypothetical protein
VLLIPCPWCGLRDEIEFSYGGEAHIVRPRDRPLSPTSNGLTTCSCGRTHEESKMSSGAIRRVAADGFRSSAIRSLIRSPAPIASESRWEG